MKAALRAIHSPDVGDLPNWDPPPGPFVLLVQLFVGEAGGRGTESIDISVCNPAWINERASTEHVVDLRHHIVVDQFDFPALRAYLAKRVEAVEGSDWSEIAEKLGRLGHWEFEDYRPGES